jgi:hypothetical protein
MSAAVLFVFLLSQAGSRSRFRRPSFRNKINTLGLEINFYLNWGKGIIAGRYHKHEKYHKIA